MAIATGVLMHRLVLDSVDAEAHLLQLAEARGVSSHEEAARVLYS